jgi:uncharacterized protein
VLEPSSYSPAERALPAGARPVRGKDRRDAGVAFRFGSVPNEAESTGPIWSPRQDTMFLAIQHPGEETSVKGGVYGQPATSTSYWPRGNKTTGANPSEPLPSVIAIRRS